MYFKLRSELPMKKFFLLILFMFIFFSSTTIYSKDDSESDSGITEENSDTNGSDLVSDELEKKQVDDIPNKTKIKWHIKPQYDEAHSFSEGLAAVCKNEKWGYIDYNGRLVTLLQKSRQREHPLR